jgi:hypothetical protein
MMRRRSLDDSSSAWPGAVSAFRLIEYGPVRARDAGGPESPLQPRDVVDPDRLARRRGDRELAHHIDVAALALQHANRHRVLLAGFAIRRDLVVTGHHQPERVADRGRPAPAGIATGSSPACAGKTLKVTFWDG